MIPHRYDPPTYRPLKVYAFDPTRGQNLDNHMTVRVGYEQVAPGPVGHYLAVIDYDAGNRTYYQPVDLDAREVLIRGGLDPSESDPRFHQQMVYAVVMDTIRRFEFALGRRIKWKRDTSPASDPFHGKLRIFPPGIQEANAFYDPNLRALVFGYFQAVRDNAGANIPGQTVFTCLSHDIVAHETTHALVDGLREKFTTASNPDTPAFHEAFADIVALFQHFSYTEALLDTVNRTGGMIHRLQLAPDASPEGDAAIAAELPGDNPLVGLARQFGEAAGMRGVLRSALGSKPNSRDLDTVTEPHARGSILVAAVFDAFFTVYLKRTRDLMSIGRAGGAVASNGALHPDLAGRLAGEASKIAGNFSNICIRALDYCPPVDIRFGEFLRAVVTADHDLVPSDPWGYRAALIEAFRSRGIVPEDVGSYSEEALRWGPPEPKDPRKPVPPCAGLDFDVLGDHGPDGNRRNAAVLHKWAQRNAAALGLSTKYPIQAHSFHSLHRVGPDGRLVFDYVVEFLQKREAPLYPKDPKSPKFTFNGGSTVILNRHGAIRYAVVKRVDNERRLESQRAFHQGAGDSIAAAAYAARPDLEAMDFCAVHRGY